MKIKGMKVSQIINTKNKKENMEFDFFLCFTADHEKLIDARGTCAGIEGPDTTYILQPWALISQSKFYECNFEQRQLLSWRR